MGRRFDRARILPFFVVLAFLAWIALPELLAGLGRIEGAGAQYAYLPVIVRQPTPTPTPTPQPRVPNDPYYGSYQWDYPIVNAPQAWGYSLGTGVLVAVLDSGADPAHPDLQAHLRTDIDYDYVNADADASDDNGHGSHVAGTVAAVTNNGLGVAGMAWDARILPLKVLDAQGNGRLSDAATAIRYAADQGAKVINLSLGSDPKYDYRCPTDTPYLQDAIDYAYNKGALVVVAAGNANANLDVSGVTPANCNRTLTVAATTITDTRASYSNYGSPVDVAAPGGDAYAPILSTYPVALTPSGYAPYVWMSGTSMAAPHVAGLAALLFARYPTYTPDQVASAILDRATDRGSAGWDAYFGCGRIDAAASLALGAAGSSPKCRTGWVVAAEGRPRPEAFVPGSFVPGRLLIAFEAGVAPQSLELEALGVTLERRLPGDAWIARVPVGAEREIMARLLRTPGVRYAHPDLYLSAPEVPQAFGP